MPTKTVTRIAALAIGLAFPLTSLTIASAQTAPEVEKTETLQAGETATFSKGDRPLVIDMYQAEQPAPNCISWRESKGFTQVTNNCQADLAIKVYYDHDKASACETVSKGTQHNIGYAGWGPWRRNVQRVVTC
ncbi:hypothetical protein [Corynebacterium auriscanis]|uniref:Uncharacterized protein n=2 Tax=Corynebacteriaceae TaxID=1653 RepID=A0A0A2DMX7_9CORY|nr:hypothetical protein [Corynebacterium auriscanis]KGM18251.1 hypothetical protein MA47_09275 [Corynebacterium auriscanis]WJY72281.1 Alpha amylase inhibitor [Corynebacterium auriscanis]